MGPRSLSKRDFCEVPSPLKSMEFGVLGKWVDTLEREIYPALVA